MGNGNSNGDDLLGSNGIRKSEHHSTPYNPNKTTSINTNAVTTGHHQFGGQHTRVNTSGPGLGMVNNNNNNNSGGPLLDFKSAFSVLDDKPGGLR